MFEPKNPTPKTECQRRSDGCTELTSEEDWRLGWVALSALRPNLSQEDFLARRSQLQLDGYHLIGLFRDNAVVCIASYTVSPHPVFEREMIIHDMATAMGEQSKGYGSEMLSYLDGLAVQIGCKRTFVASAKAADFYEKNGYVAYARALKKVHQ